MALADSYCRGCIYLGYVSDRVKCCNYIFATGKRRPCPAGKGCTEKTKGLKPRNTKVGEKTKCEFCGAEFVMDINGKQKFCRPECRYKANRMKNQERKIQDGQTENVRDEQNIHP